MSTVRSLTWQWGTWDQGDGGSVGGGERYQNQLEKNNVWKCQWCSLVCKEADVWQTLVNPSTKPLSWRNLGEHETSQNPGSLKLLHFILTRWENLISVILENVCVWKGRGRKNDLVVFIIYLHEIQREILPNSVLLVEWKKVSEHHCISITFILIKCSRWHLTALDVSLVQYLSLMLLWICQVTFTAFCAAFTYTPHSLYL